jgi:hypothetical protein
MALTAACIGYMVEVKFWGWLQKHSSTKRACEKMHLQMQ